jgi:alpha/beta superfamily hydrolase
VGDAAFLASKAAASLGIRSPSGAFLAGHSFGGGVAAAAIASPGLSGVISISPGRRIRERFMDSGRRDDLQYVRLRKSRDMALEEPMPLDVTAAMLASYDIANLGGARVPKPLLIVEGALEPEVDLAFTRSLVAGIGGPLEHVVIPGADHYFGTSLDTSVKGRAWKVSREEVVDSLADAMMNWIGGVFAMANQVPEPR